VKNLGISNFNTSSAGMEGSMCIMSALSEFSCATISTLLPEPTAGRTVDSQKRATRLRHLASEDLSSCCGEHWHGGEKGEIAAACASACRHVV
jgi:hypothetical protein